jgi:hypothetical protein
VGAALAGVELAGFGVEGGDSSSDRFDLILVTPRIGESGGDVDGGSGVDRVGFGANSESEDGLEVDAAALEVPKADPSPPMPNPVSAEGGGVDDDAGLEGVSDLIPNGLVEAGLAPNAVD